MVKVIGIGLLVCMLASPTAFSQGLPGPTYLFELGDCEKTRNATWCKLDFALKPGAIQVQHFELHPRPADTCAITMVGSETNEPGVIAQLVRYSCLFSVVRVAIINHTDEAQKGTADLIFGEP